LADEQKDTHRVVVDPRKCVLSGECFKVCPQKAISIRDGKAWIDPSKCDLDGVCIPACPKGAICLRRGKG
jgi:NAD-dependent dihydropyrimidine dehydrogenase PreA subunit